MLMSWINHHRVDRRRAHARHGPDSSGVRDVIDNSSERRERFPPLLFEKNDRGLANSGTQQACERLVSVFGDVFERQLRASSERACSRTLDVFEHRHRSTRASARRGVREAVPTHLQRLPSHLRTRNRASTRRTHAHAVPDPPRARKPSETKRVRRSVDRVRPAFFRPRTRLRLDNGSCSEHRRTPRHTDAKRPPHAPFDARCEHVRGELAKRTRWTNRAPRLPQTLGTLRRSARRYEPSLQFETQPRPPADDRARLEGGSGTSRAHARVRSRRAPFSTAQRVETARRPSGSRLPVTLIALPRKPIEPVRRPPTGSRRSDRRRPRSRGLGRTLPRFDDAASNPS